MKNPRPYNEEQEEAHTLAREGLTWSEIICHNPHCKHEWVGAHHPERPYGLECPKCKCPDGNIRHEPKKK